MSKFDDYKTRLERSLVRALDEAEKGKISMEKAEDIAMDLCMDFYIQLIDDGVEALVEDDEPMKARSLLMCIHNTTGARLKHFEERYIEKPNIIVKD